MTTAVDIIFITPVGPIVRQVKDGDYATPARALATDLEAAEAEVAPVAILSRREESYEAGREAAA